MKHITMSRERIAKSFLLAMFVALGITVASLFSAPQAHAGSSCAETGQCIQVDLNDKFVSDLIGSNAWSPISGGSYGLPPNMHVVSQRKMTSAEYSKYCLKSWNDTEGWLVIYNPSTGKYVSFKTFAPTGWAGKLSNGGTSYTCDYPTFAGSELVMNTGSNSREWKDSKGDKSVFFCVLDHSGSVTRSANSYAGKQATVKSLGKQVVTTREQLIIKGLAACKSEYNIDVKYDFPAGNAGYGQYTAQANATVIACQFLNAKGSKSGQITHSANCGKPEVRSSKYQMTRWCENGGTKFVKGLFSKKWDDCESNGGESSGKASSSCSVVGKSAVDGVNTATVDLLRDGSSHAFTWGKPKVSGTGVSNVRNWRVKTDIVPGSTPYTGSDPNGAKQYFNHDLVTPNVKNGLIGQWYNLPATGAAPTNVGSDNVKFYKSGDRGKNFKLQRNYMYDATMTVETQRIDGIDVMTGKPNIVSSTAKSEVKNATCNGQTSPNVNVLKALNDSY